MSNKKEKPAHRPECPTPKGKLLAIGGSENKGSGPKQGSNQENNTNFSQFAVLERFCKELKGENPMVIILPIASSEPKEMAKTYQEAFEKLGVRNVRVLDARSRSEVDSPENLRLIEQAEGFMLTGGDQLQITSILGGTQLMEILKERYTYEPIIIAGTSAGATALSTPMIYSAKTEGGFLKGDVYITTGLEFMHDVAVDTHFIARGRLYRMTQMILTNPQCIGIGLEEDTAILFTEGKQLEVIGSGLITIVSGKGISHTNIHEIEAGVPITVRGLQIDLLGQGDTYTLPIHDQRHK
jgi:cyanophycinase